MVCMFEYVWLLQRWSTFTIGYRSSSGTSSSLWTKPWRTEWPWPCERPSSSWHWPCGAIPFTAVHAAGIYQVSVCALSQVWWTCESACLPACLPVCLTVYLTVCLPFLHLAGVVFSSLHSVYLSINYILASHLKCVYVRMIVCLHIFRLSSHPCQQL